MRIGIVGHEGAKFSPAAEQRARKVINALLSAGDVVISGKCHLGGIDIWAAEEGRKRGLEVIEFEPEVLQWNPIGKKGFMARNLDIARESDVVYSLVVDELPRDYSGMRFELCYHCNRKDHVKSGGCWTAKQAKRLGNRGEIIVIKQYEE